jgi:hypothetical protein
MTTRTILSIAIPNDSPCLAYITQWKLQKNNVSKRIVDIIESHATLYDELLDQRQRLNAATEALARYHQACENANLHLYNSPHARGWGFKDDKGAIL